MQIYPWKLHTKIPTFCCQTDAVSCFLRHTRQVSVPRCVMVLIIELLAPTISCTSPVDHFNGNVLKCGTPGQGYTGSTRHHLGDAWKPFLNDRMSRQHLRQDATTPARHFGDGWKRFESAFDGRSATPFRVHIDTETESGYRGAVGGSRPNRHDDDQAHLMYVVEKPFYRMPGTRAHHSAQNEGN